MLEKEITDIIELVYFDESLPIPLPIFLILIFKNSKFQNSDYAKFKTTQFWFSKFELSLFRISKHQKFTIVVVELQFISIQYLARHPNIEYGQAIVFLRCGACKPDLVSQWKKSVYFPILNSINLVLDNN